MKFFRNYGFLLSCLIGFQALVASNIEIHKITEIDILQAKNELEKKAQVDQLIRRVFVTGVATVAAFTLFKIAKWSLASKEAAPTKFFGPPDLAESYSELEKRLNGLEKKNSSGWLTTTIGFGAQTFLLPVFIQRCESAFGRPSVRRFVNAELELLGYFERLRDAQVVWQTSNETLALVKACDDLIQQVTYTIAYVRYVMPNYSNTLVIYADQLQLATYEFAVNAEKLIINNQKRELIDVINLFKTTFTVLLNNILIFN